MTWKPWRRRIDEAREAVKKAEQLRDHAEAQQAKVEEIATRVDAVAPSLQKLRRENHIGPLIDAILRGNG